MRTVAKRGLFLLIGLVCLYWVSTALAIENRAGGEVIIKLRSGAQIDPILQHYGSTLRTRLWNAPTYRVSVPRGLTQEQFLAQLRVDAEIEQARPDTHHFQLSLRHGEAGESVSGRPIVFRDGKDIYERQRALALLRIGQAHLISRGAGSLVAIIDTGCDLEHPLLRGRISKLSYDFVDSDSLPAEVAPPEEAKNSIFGHGTFVAGIVALAAPQADLLILRAFDATGMASDFDIANALRYAADYGATVINLSCSAGKRDELVAEALVYARARGAVIVVAAGNDNLESPVPFPAAEPQVLAVAATDLNDVKAKFSNFGNHIACAAPGTGLFSIYPGKQFAEWSGTSFAAPWVSACLALLRAGGVVADRAAIEAVKASSINISRRNPAFIGKLGAGRISFGRALNRGQGLGIRSQGPEIKTLIFSPWSLTPDS